MNKFLHQHIIMSRFIFGMETGQVQWLLHKINDKTGSQKEGLWQYFNSDGSSIKNELYKAGEIIKTTKAN